jgi:predicted phosphate transport protein (TIGR00153 family)
MEVHASESVADDIRRDIELQMYKKALIPESRGDVLGLIESMDMVPNLFQSLCDQLLYQQIEVPPEFRERYLELVEVNIDSYNLLREAILALFYRRDCQEQLRRIDAKESESDGIERGLVKDIFSTDLDKADKILLKEIVVNTGDISDTVEIAADRLNLALIKSRI